MLVPFEPISSIAIEALLVAPDDSNPPVLFLIGLSPSKFYAGVTVPLQERRLGSDLSVAQESRTTLISSSSAGRFGKIEFDSQSTSAFC